MCVVPHLEAIKIHNGNGFLMSNDKDVNLLTIRATVGNLCLFPKDSTQETCNLYLAMGFVKCRLVYTSCVFHSILMRLFTSKIFYIMTSCFVFGNYQIELRDSDFCTDYFIVYQINLFVNYRSYN